MALRDCLVAEWICASSLVRARRAMEPMEAIIDRQAGFELESFLAQRAARISDGASSAIEATSRTSARGGHDGYAASDCEAEDIAAMGSSSKSRREGEGDQGLSGIARCLEVERRCLGWLAPPDPVRVNGCVVSTTESGELGNRWAPGGA